MIPLTSGEGYSITGALLGREGSESPDEMVLCSFLAPISGGSFDGKISDGLVATLSGEVFATDDWSGNLSSESVPAAFELSGNYPNPFNPETDIEFAIPHTGRVVLRIYDAKGRLVKTLENRDFIAGRHTSHWDGLDDRGLTVGSGVYFSRLSFGGSDLTRKMILVK